MNYLSSKNRPFLIQELSQNQFDLCIIGGGITGAGIALDAASRGMKVALIEKLDFGSGTSSKSTKLIHGGLRYLKQLEIQLVREVGSERAIVHKLAPHLVVPEKMLLPLIKGGTYGPWSTSLGLKVYDILAGVKGDDKRKMLNAKKTLAREPLLSPEGLLGSGYYAEYRTDDARLTIENIKTAGNYGALCLNYAEALDFEYEDEKVKGVKVKDLLSNELFDIQCKFIINATGPWVDQLREKDKSLSGKHLFLSKGVHIVVPFEKLPLKQSIYFDNTDGRMIFAIPRHRATYIGTTDTPYEGDPNHIPIDLEDVNYLLEATNQMFPSIHLKVEDVESSWAGLRPLIYEEGKSASEMSRKDEIFLSPSGLVSIAGGKLTGYRKMAERVVNVIAKKFNTDSSKKLKRNHTDKIALAGGALKNQNEVGDLLLELKQIVHAKKLPAYYAEYLCANYGKHAVVLLGNMDPKELDPELALLKEELNYTLEAESVNTALDFLNRRTGRLYFNIPSVLKYKTQILAELQARLDWSADRAKTEAIAIDEAIAHISNFTAKKALISS